MGKALSVDEAATSCTSPDAGLDSSLRAYLGRAIQRLLGEAALQCGELLGQGPRYAKRARGLR
jgi:hypothetical protein